MNRFAIVTPSHNQGIYLPETIESVITQKGDFAIDYVVIDGGSIDNSISILSDYEEKIKRGAFEKKCRELRFRWVSEKDEGQYDAINKGFELADGNIMAWINSDDKYTPWAFSVVSEIFSTFSFVEWLSSVRPLTWNANGQAVVIGNYDGFNKKSFFRGKNLCTGKWFNGNWIAQDSTFWTKNLWQECKGLDNRYHYAADFLLWTEFYHHAELYGVDSPLAGYRFHDRQKTMNQGIYNSQAEEIFFANGGKPYSPVESFFREKVFSPAVKSKTLMRCLRKFGLLYPAKTFRCLNRQARWELFVDHIV